MQEFGKRLRIALAILAGYGCGRLAAGFTEQHPSEFFSAGFLLGVLVTQGLLSILAGYRARNR
ncbi:MAG: hypothetical protein FIA97_06935 [Methylococcaceae bacterium]|nr:hypothetical protein [Methylococcaceae bacterium]